MEPPPTFIDLFAGCGGITRGFIDADFRLAGAVESGLHPAATYAANFGEDLIFHGDIQKYVDVPLVDVVVGGPPCQGFSSLGKRDPGDKRNGLWREYAKVVRASGCSIFVLENVDRFAQSAELESLQRSASRSDGVLRGFRIQTFTLNAADFGVPQRRVRTIIVGSRIGPVTPPKAMFSRAPDEVHAPWRTLADSIEPMNWNPEAVALPDEEEDFFGQTVPGRFKLQDIHVGRRYSDLSKQRFVYIKPGGGRRALPEHLKAECWKTHDTGSFDVLGRLEWDKPSVTIRTEFFKPEKGRYLHPAVHRALTHAEAAILQGFDDRHVWCGKKVEIARMIGNAVPPPMAKAVGVAVRDRLLST
jgi:DNA (cytosine-5)-methyltransferase 1